jgi:hypothetical protein
METRRAGEQAPAHGSTLIKASGAVKTMVCRALHIVHRMVEARTRASAADQWLPETSGKDWK